MEYGITTSVLAGGNAPEKPAEPDEEQDETLEVPANKDGKEPARPEIRFQNHRQEGNREVVRGLPANLKTSPLRSGRRGNK
jgi:hypothetical protein